MEYDVVWCCPECRKELGGLLLKQKIYRHLLAHGYSEDRAKLIADPYPPYARVSVPQPPEPRKENM